jgi:hypothetical protein
MDCRGIEVVTKHAVQRLAQRNLSQEDVRYVFAHGRRIHSGHALFVCLGRRDIPMSDRHDDARTRLEGTVLVLDAATGRYLTTVYRNRRSGIRDVKRKTKRSL